MRIELSIVSALGGDGSSVRPRHRAGTASLEAPTAPVFLPGPGFHLSIGEVGV